jgi:hypothetical protein
MEMKPGVLVDRTVELLSIDPSANWLASPRDSLSLIRVHEQHPNEQWPLGQKSVVVVRNRPFTDMRQ